MKMTLSTKFLLSYIAIFLLPILSLGMFTFFVSSKMLTGDAMSKNTLTLQKASNLVDAQIQQVNEIPILYSLNDTYRGFRMKDDPYKALTVQKDMRNSIITNNFISDMFLFFHGDDYLISSTTTVTVSGFQDFMYNYENWSDDSFLEDLNNVSLPTIRTKEKAVYLSKMQMQLITFMAPVGRLQGDSYATILIILDVNTIRSLVENAGMLKESDFLILDQNNRLISSFTEYNYLDNEDFCNLLESKNSDGIFMLDGKKYHLAQKTSTYNGITYLSVTPLSALTGSISQMQLFFSLGICLLFGLAGLAIAFFLNRNYTPIKSLKQFSETLIIQHSEENPFFKDDIAQIRRCLEYLNENNLSLQKQVMNSREYMRDCLIFNLIRGKFSSLAQFNEEAERSDITLLNGFYTVAVLYSKSYDVKKGSEIIKEIEDHFDVTYTIYGHQHLDGEKIILVINLASEDIQSLPKDMGRLIDILADSFGRRPTIGLGRCCDKVEYITKSFIEATAAADYHIVRGGGRVITYDECVPAGKYDQVIATGRVGLIGKYLKSADQNAIHVFLNEIREHIDQSQIPIFVVKSLCFDIIREIQKSTSNLYEISDSYTDALNLLEYETADELLDKLDNVCKEICETVLKNSLNESSSRISEMIRYIETNCKNPDFSTDKMAETFEVSAPTLCQYFKSKTNKTITDYLVDFRINRAKELLTSTAYPLSQISYEVGYYNVSSFIRRFKQVTGFSPGVYREENRKQL